MKTRRNAYDLPSVT